MSEAIFTPKPDRLDCYRFEREQTIELPAAWLDIPKLSLGHFRASWEGGVLITGHFESKVAMEEDTEFYIDKIEENTMPPLDFAEAGKFYLWCAELKMLVTCLWCKTTATWDMR